VPRVPVNLDFIPSHSTWEQWNANLVHYFSQQHIPVLPEEEWQTVANILVNNPVWSSYNVPSGIHFNNWEDWASAFTLAVNGAQSR